MTTKTKQWIGIAFVAVSYVCFSFLVWHTDVVCLAGWAKAFWDGLAEGRFFDYAYVATERTGYPINYNIIMAIVDALFVAPLYVVDAVMSRDISLAYYICLFKVWLVAAIAGNVYYLRKLLQLRGYDANTIWTVCGLFLMSGTVIHGNLGTGQVDCIASMFLIMTMYYLYAKEYSKMCLAAGMLVICKGIGILFFFPIFLLLFGKDLLRMVRYGIIVLVPSLVGFVLSHFVFRDFAKIMAESERGWNHMARFFDNRLFNYPMFFGIYGFLCVICLAKAYRGSVNTRDYVRYPLLVFLALSAFVFLAPYWFIYGVVFIILAILELPVAEERYMVYAGLNIGYWAYVVTRHVNSNDNAMARIGMVAHFTGERDNGVTYMDCINHYLPGIAPYAELMAMALYLGFLAYLAYAYARIDGVGENRSNVCDPVWKVLYVGVSVLIPIGYLLTSIVLYFH